VEFKLQVTIAGLFILLDDAKNNCLHLIAPSIDGGSHGSGHYTTHVAKLVVFGASPRDMKGMRLALGGAGNKAAIPPSGALRVVDCGTGFGSKLKSADVLQNPPNLPMATHLMLQGGKLSGLRPFCFKSSTKPCDKVPLLLQWEVGIEEGSEYLLPAPTRFEDGDPDGDPIVVPIDATGIASVAFVFVEPDGVPKKLSDLLTGTPTKFDKKHLEAHKAFWPSGAFDLDVCSCEPTMTTPMTFPHICPTLWDEAV
jgi:hypothetical protein